MTQIFPKQIKQEANNHKNKKNIDQWKDWLKAFAVVFGAIIVIGFFTAYDIGPIGYFVVIVGFLIYYYTRPGKIGLISCPNCKYYGGAYKTIKGNGVIELILWLFFIIPGIIYSIWRGNTKSYRCPQCHYEYVVLRKEVNKPEEL